MNDFMMEMRMAKIYKERYPAGTRIEMLCMGSDPHPIEPGTRGTVVHVDDIGQIHMKWDNGRTLAIVPSEDAFKIIKEG